VEGELEDLETIQKHDSCASNNGHTCMLWDDKWLDEAAKFSFA